MSSLLLSNELTHLLFIIPHASYFSSSHFFPSSPSQIVGNRGKDTQSTMHSYHAATGVIYYAQINKNAVSCWNSNRELKAANFKEIVRDNEKLIYPSDLSVSTLLGTIL
jgi:hypothetical protein